MSKLFNVLIIGAGNIGAFYDNPQSKNILTHAHAFKKHFGFNLLGFVDLNSQRAQDAANLWGVEAFPTLDAALSKHHVDIVVVAVSDEHHYSVLKELSKYSLKLIFTEKPLTKKIDEGTEIVDIFKERNIPIIINYSRRFVPEFSTLKDEIASGAFGTYLSGSGYYGKGTLHNGSHMVDLLIFLFGNIYKTQTVSRVYDHYDDDPSCSAILTIKSGGKFFMQGIDCRGYSLFELDLLFEKQRVRIFESGFKIEYYEVVESQIFAGYHELKKTKCIDTKLINSISLASDSIYRFLTLGLSCPSRGNEGILSQNVCSSIINHYIEKL